MEILPIIAWDYHRLVHSPFHLVDGRRVLLRKHTLCIISLGYLYILGTRIFHASLLGVSPSIFLNPTQGQH